MQLPDPQQESWKQQAAEAAAKLIEDGMVIGLGSPVHRNVGGSCAGTAHSSRFASGGGCSNLKSDAAPCCCSGNPTDYSGHPSRTRSRPGWGRRDRRTVISPQRWRVALLREKIVASVSKRFLVVADQSKQVTDLGEHFPLPVEVIPFAAHPVRKRLEDLGATVTPRHQAGSAFVTDNNNMIFDCRFPNRIDDPEALDAHIHQIVGVVETGFFFHLAHQAVIGGPYGVQRLP